MVDIKHRFLKAHKNIEDSDKICVESRAYDAALATTVWSVDRTSTTVCGVWI